MKSMRELMESVSAIPGLGQNHIDPPELERLKHKAQQESKEGYGQHVNKDANDGHYYISDWYDSDETVASYENGRQLNTEAIELGDHDDAPGWFIVSHDDTICSGPYDSQEEAYADVKRLRWFDPSKHVIEYGLDNDGMYVSDSIDEKAPPGEEGLVKNLKKEYPGHEEKAFATAWSIYDKKRGKKEESMEEAQVDSCRQSNPANTDVACAMEESVEQSQNYIEARQKMSDLLGSFVDSEKAFDIISRELEDKEIEDDEFDEIMSSLENTFFPDSVSYSDSHIDSAERTGYDTNHSDFPVDESSTGSGVHTFDSTGEAYDACQTDDNINDGDTLLIPSEGVVGIAGTWPVAISKEAGELHSLTNPDLTDEEIAKTIGVPVEKVLQAKSHLGKLEEAFDMQNGYGNEKFANGKDYFPNGADSPVVSATGPSGARQGDNPEQKKMQVEETHKELVYSYRNFLKEDAAIQKKKLNEKSGGSSVSNISVEDWGGKFDSSSKHISYSGPVGISADMIDMRGNKVHIGYDIAISASASIDWESDSQQDSFGSFHQAEPTYSDYSLPSASTPNIESVSFVNGSTFYYNNKEISLQQAQKYVDLKQLLNSGLYVNVVSSAFDSKIKDMDQPSPDTGF